MALRVLLGDESATIKKVIQLALQDYSVEVKSVHLGLDIIDVAKSFHPHIIFMDVLLQKKNGYEVCSEIKADAELSDLPVVLMWSSFMSLDEDKYRECGADARLEKPFEVDDLRGIVQGLVPLVQENKISPFLKFSPHITQQFKEEVQKGAHSAPPQTQNEAPKADQALAPAKGTAAQKSPAPAAPPLEMTASAPVSMPEPSAEKESWSMDDFENIEEFSLDEDLVTEEPSAPQGTGLFQSPQADPWAAQNLDEFRVDLQESDEEDFVITTLEDQEPTAMELTQIDTPEVATQSGLELSRALSDIPAPPTKESTLLNPSVKKMVDDYLQRAFHNQLEAHLEKALRELLPQIATRVIKEEIERLTRNLD